MGIMNLVVIQNLSRPFESYKGLMLHVRNFAFMFLKEKIVKF